MADPTVVFLGDSITEGSPWASAFPGVNGVNLGVSGERTYHVAQRLGAVPGYRPSAIVLLIGINDLLGDGAAPAAVSTRTRELARDLTGMCPDARLVIESIYPIRPAGRTSGQPLPAVRRALADIQATNGMYKSIALELGASYLDLYPELVDESGQLRAEYTDDGLHLTQAGYDATVPLLAPAVRAAVEVSPE